MTYEHVTYEHVTYEHVTYEHVTYEHVTYEHVIRACDIRARDIRACVGATVPFVLEHFDFREVVFDFHFHSSDQLTRERRAQHTVTEKQRTVSN